jgi:HK97 family phage prohead protease
MTVKLNKAGERHAAALIAAGKYDKDAAWSFSAEDGDALLGENGDDWKAYAAVHLGEDDEADEATKARWKYPLIKDGKVYASALRASRSRASQQGSDAIFKAAGKLIDALNKKAGDGEEEDEGRGASNIGILTRATDMVPSTVDEDERTVDAAISTGAPVKRSDWRDGDYIEKLSMDPKAIRLERLNRGAAFIDSHNYWGGTGAMLGAVVPGSARVEKGELRARIKFSRSDEGERAFQDMKDGVLRHVSVGYLTHKFEVDDTTSPPTRNATDWEPHEVSAVAIPADPRAGFRALRPARAMSGAPSENSTASKVDVARTRMRMMRRSAAG